MSFPNQSSRAENASSEARGEAVLKIVEEQGADRALVEFFEGILDENLPILHDYPSIQGMYYAFYSSLGNWRFALERIEEIERALPSSVAAASARNNTRLAKQAIYNEAQRVHYRAFRDLNFHLHYLVDQLGLGNHIAQDADKNLESLSIKISCLLIESNPERQLTEKSAVDAVMFVVGRLRDDRWLVEPDESLDDPFKPTLTEMTAKIREYLGFSIFNMILNQRPLGDGVDPAVLFTQSWDHVGTLSSIIDTHLGPASSRRRMSLVGHSFAHKFDTYFYGPEQKIDNGSFDPTALADTCLHWTSAQVGRHDCFFIEQQYTKPGQANERTRIQISNIRAAIHQRSLSRGSRSSSDASRPPSRSSTPVMLSVLTQDDLEPPSLADCLDKAAAVLAADLEKAVPGGSNEPLPAEIGLTGFQLLRHRNVFRSIFSEEQAEKTEERELVQRLNWNLRILSILVLQAQNRLIYQDETVSTSSTGTILRAVCFWARYVLESIQLAKASLNSMSK